MQDPRLPTTAPEYPERARPPHVQRLARPPALCRATRLAFLRFEKPDLERARRFYEDFGLQCVDARPDRLLFRGADPASVALVVTRGPRARFVGAAFTVADDADLRRLAARPGASVLDAARIPGGGEGVALADPDGHEVWLIRHQAPMAAGAANDAPPAAFNSVGRTARVNATVRWPVEPASVARLGHVVLQSTDFATMADWYMTHLGLLPTDVQYLPDGSPLLCFFRLDLGAQPADHHTVVIAGGIEARYEHSAWEVASLDALGQGQQVLRARGHRHMWGIGRHVLGSQLFDYWYDDDGFEFEHYTDGDVFTADREAHYVPFSTGSIWAWGDDAPPTMFPKKSPALLWRALKLIRQGRMTLARLRMIGGLLGRPARPWL